MKKQFRSGAHFPTTPLVMALILGSSLISSCNKKSEAWIHPKQDSLVVSVYANATLEAVDQYQLFPAISGRVVEVFAKEGDVLQIGSPILRIDNQVAANMASTAIEAAKVAKENENQLKELEWQLNVVKDQFKLDSLNYYRQKRLWEQQIGTLNQLEQRKLAWEASSNSVKTLKNKIQIAKKQLKFNSLQASNSSTNSNKQLSDLTVSSAIHGTLFSLNAHVGDWISQQKPLGVIGNSSSYLIKMNVDEVDIAKIQPGQTAIVSLDAYANKSFKAKVMRVIPIMDAKSQSFTVEAAFEEVPEKLFPGLTAEVNIVTQVKPQALLIPIAYLSKDNQVITHDGNVTVTPGLRNLEWVEILKGLDAKTEIQAPVAKKK